MKNKAAITVLIVLIVLTVGFIWNNSRKPEEQSNNESQAVADKVEQVVGLQESNEKKTYTQFVQKIRKAAHAAEFFVLGLETALFAVVISSRLDFQKLWNVISFSLAVAVSDESIQIISNRGPKVQDVLIDLCGAAVGTAVVFSVKLIISHCKKRRKKHGKA